MEGQPRMEGRQALLANGDAALAALIRARSTLEAGEGG